MGHPAHTTVTQLLAQVRDGNQAAMDQLFPLVYEELRKRAHNQRQRWQGDYTLNTTALVHEAYIKLADQAHTDWESRAHFLAIAAKAMRHILMDYAKRRQTQKRGGQYQKLSFDEIKGTLEKQLAFSDERADILVLLDEALQRLERINKRESRIVECRFFGGMTIKETAIALGISPATVTRDWAMVQAWLYNEIQQAMAS